jgi:hypothetical protein
MHYIVYALDERGRNGAAQPAWEKSWALATLIAAFHNPDQEGLRHGASRTVTAHLA